MDELQQAILQRIQDAMNDASQDALSELHRATDEFYAGGTPVRYERTGLLGKTPKVEAAEINGNTVSFEAGLETGYGYSTGKHPTMSEVLTLANTGFYSGLRPTVGQPYFWNKAKENIIRNTEQKIRSYL